MDLSKDTSQNEHEYPDTTCKSNFFPSANNFDSKHVIFLPRPIYHVRLSTYIWTSVLLIASASSFFFSFLQRLVYSLFGHTISLFLSLFTKTHQPSKTRERKKRCAYTILLSKPSGSDVISEYRPHRHYNPLFHINSKT